MQWAIAFHPDQIATGPKGLSRLMVPPILIAEACIQTARGQGWVVLGLDSEVYADRKPFDLQSGPQRHEDEGDGA